MNRFDKVSNYYNKFMNRFSLYKEKEVGELLTIKNIDSLLDIGAGTCHYSNYLSKDIKHIMAIDNSVNMLKYADDLVSTKEVDVYNGIPFEDEIYDAVIMCDFIHHLKKGNHQRLINEVSRVLKKNGEFVIYDFEKTHFKTKILYLFELFIFFQKMDYISVKDLIKILENNNFEITKQVIDDYTYVIKGVKK